MRTIGRKVASGAFVTVCLLAGACFHSRAVPVSSTGTIAGVYRAYSGPNTLEFDGTSWTLITGDRVFSGKFVVAGDEIVFLLTFSNHVAYQDFCRDDLDVYTWSLVGDMLTLRPARTTSTERAEGRPCNTIADQVFRNGPWTKTG